MKVYIESKRFGKLELEIESERDFEFLRKLTDAELPAVESAVPEFVYVPPTREKRKYKERHKKRWTQEEKAIVGRYDVKVAKKMLPGRSVHAIYVMRRKIGLR